MSNRVAKHLPTNQVHPPVAQQYLSGLTRLGWGPASQREAVHVGRAEVASQGCRILVEEAPVWFGLVFFFINRLQVAC